MKLIGEIEKNQQKVIRVSTDNFKGQDVVDIRTFFIPPGKDDYFPSLKGVNFKRDKLNELIEILQRIK